MTHLRMLWIVVNKRWWAQIFNFLTVVKYSLTINTVKENIHKKLLFSVNIYIYTIKKNEGRDGSTGSTTFDCFWKIMECCVGTKYVVFCSCYYAPTLFRNLQKRSLAWCKRDTLQTRYRLWVRSDFPYYNLPHSFPSHSKKFEMFPLSNESLHFYLIWNSKYVC